MPAHARSVRGGVVGLSLAYLYGKVEEAAALAAKPSSHGGGQGGPGAAQQYTVRLAMLELYNEQLQVGWGPLEGGACVWLEAWGPHVCRQGGARSCVTEARVCCSEVMRSMSPRDLAVRVSH